MSVNTPELRVAVAHDILNRVIHEVQIVRTGYVVLHDGRYCGACMVGTLYISLVKLLADHVINTVPVHRAAAFTERGKTRLLEQDFEVLLYEVFTREQLSFMEAAFMQGTLGQWGDPLVRSKSGSALRLSTVLTYYSPKELERELSYEAVLFVARMKKAIRTFPLHTERALMVKGILENLIEHGGEFRPS